MYFDLSIFSNDGITQDERYIKALSPSYISVDERDILDLMNFMFELSSRFNYYDVNNTIKGDWSDFFTADINILLIVISKFNMSSQIIEFSQLENGVYLAENDKELFTALKNLFDFVENNTLNKLGSLQKWLQNIQDKDQTDTNQPGLSQNPDETEIRQKKIKADERLKMISEMRDIVEDLDAEKITLKKYIQEAGKLPGGQFNSVDITSPLNDDKPVDNESSIFSNGRDVRERILNGLNDIKKVFNDLGTRYNHLVGVTNFYLKSNDLLEQDYNPSLALCFAFLHLFMHLKQKINNTTKNHLDLYYKQILGLNPKPADSDSVHVIFEKVPTMPAIELNAGEELLAQVPGLQEPVIYTLNESILITAAQIAEAKTLYLADHSQESEQTRAKIEEIQVYCGEYPCGTAADFLKNKSNSKTWPILGRDQYGLPANEQTMAPANLGFMLASPVLYLPEGNRTIVFEFYVEDHSLKELTKFFKNYSKVDKRDLDSVTYHLLSNAFVIEYTDPKGWVEVKKYNAALNNDLGKIEIEIVINKSEQLIDVYNPKVHGGNFDITCPIFKFLINNFSQNNAFTFLRNTELTRISIRADVTGSQTVKLQNNVGPLNAVNPGQIFGPLPSVGSYLEIKNSNILNKYLKTLCFNFEWADLPKDPGGWEAYYRAYNNGIVSKSFKVKISTQTDTKIVPKTPAQQEYSLFETDDAGILKKTTQFQNIDIKRLGFNKNPLLEKEGLVADKNFSEGALKIELVAPDDAFGHKLFNKIFPETVINNAKIYLKNKPIPNVPYVPVVRSLTIDYELQHSEPLLSVSNKNTENSDLRIFHIHPFGFEETYPGKKSGPYYLIPDFDQVNNLYLGLKNIKTDQAISILFQLDENNFTNFRDDKAISWSYLDNNTWISFTTKDIMFDTTNNFINTGIVGIKLPPDLKDGNSILPPNLCWIRASAKGKTNVNSNVIGVYTQAALAQRKTADDHPGYVNISAGSIKMFKRKITGIQTISQPFPSFGGRALETNEQFYIRVSERLRHGQKLLTSRDIEQAILQQFPEIFMVKCINPAEYAQSNIEKGQPYLIVIVVPREQSNGSFISDEPMVSLSVRSKVARFIKKAVPSYFKVEIKNPVYEKIKVTGSITFADGIPDNGMYRQKLNDDIKRYLCPWLYDKASHFKIGSGIFLGEMLNYLKKLPYLKYITDFSIAHFYFKGTPGKIEKALVKEYTHNTNIFVKGSCPEAVLIPSKTHLISIYDPKKHPDGDKKRELGIGDFSISDELLVNLDKTTGPVEPVALNQGVGHPSEGIFFDLVVSRNLL